jgi:hypothetical protein
VSTSSSTPTNASATRNAATHTAAQPDGENHTIALLLNEG